MGAHRLARAAAVLAMLPLAACTLDGDLFVHADRVDLDVTATHRSFGEGHNGLCLPDRWDNTGVALTKLPAPDGTLACHLKGTIQGNDFSFPLLSIVVVGEDHLFLRLPPGYLFWGPENDPLTALDLTVRFPGNVVAATSGGQVVGPLVRWTDPALVAKEGLTATASLHPSIPVGVFPAGLGLVWGSALALGAAWLRRGSAPGALPRREPPADEAPANETPAGPPEPPQDPSVWASP